MACLVVIWMSLRVCGQPHALRAPSIQAKFACGYVECQSDEARQMLNLIQNDAEAGRLRVSFVSRLLCSWFEVRLVAGNESDLEHGFQIANKK